MVRPLEFPYHYGSPATLPYFCDREEELALVTRRMVGGVNVIVHAPRRYGKTSLLARSIDAARAEGAAVGSVNLLRCTNRREVAQALIQGIVAGPLARRATAHRLAGLLERIRIRPRLDVLPHGVTVSFEPSLAERDWAGAMRDMGALMNDVAGSRPLALVLDEFQQIAEIDDGLAGVFKALLDESPAVSWVLAGSHLHMMERLTSLPGAPLLAMGEVLRLGPIPDDAMAAYLMGRAERCGKQMRAPAATRICALAGPVPNDVQRLAQHAFDVAGHVVDDVAVDAGMDVAVSRDSPTFAERYERLSASQQRLVRTLALGPLAHPYARATIDRLELANDNAVRKALSALEAKELVVRRDGAWTLGDPFFRRWLVEEER